ncbi:phenylalanine ammonia-lyase [Phanerochaete sordida]|uniref:Phenylalanine ammonia-lyase n=1 Tax=Phanerochaete sordida TaxID=48140 RepID=A0A9P3GAV1_9APHY|nr:phenylalanine ammonia-lyase [Phanerochaete sordida]
MPARVDYYSNGNGYAQSRKSSAIYPSTNAAASSGHASPSTERKPELLDKFVEAYDEIQAYREGKAVIVDGHNLSIPAVAATARFGAAVALDENPETRERVLQSRRVIVDKVSTQRSVYGVSTGFGGSADTRTSDPLQLGHALLQHQHVGVLPTQTDAPLSALPLGDPLATTSMPEAWVRGAILIRMNSLIRGHSGVRWELIEKMGELLRENITPLVPLRGSISASGDLSPLSYIAGTLIGSPAIRVFDGPAAFGARRIQPANVALASHGVAPIPLSSKEHLGILNGTAFSASVGALALNEAVHLSLLAQVCTAMGTEAMIGAIGSFDSFIHDTARPHPGQVEVARVVRTLLEDSQMAVKAEDEVHIAEDEGELRQDRYPLRTAAQFLGPQIEDILSAHESVTLECNSTTDNPLIDGETGVVHHGGNFQAMAVTNAMEKTRLAIHHIGKLLFAQATELINPMMNRGLPPNLAATDPSHNYFAKGIDIHLAAYVGELGFLASPVSTHIQSAEMHNQAVNSLALISARYTISALDVLSLLTASYLYVLCQALDLRALHNDLHSSLSAVVRELLPKYFPTAATRADVLLPILERTVFRAVNTSSSADCKARMTGVAAATTTPLVDFLSADAALAPELANITAFRAELAARAADALTGLRTQYLEGERGPAPASKYLGKTRPVYEFVRVALGVPMHGRENLHNFEMGPGVEDGVIGSNIATIHEAIRDGKMHGTVMQLVKTLKATEA